MATTVIGLIEDSSEAQKAVDELLKAGFDRKDIGVVTSDMAREALTAAAGASTGMLVGGLAGMLLGATALMIPGIGPVLVAGPALTLFGGTTLGMLAGGLIGGLTAKGIPEDDAHFYAEGVRHGATLVTVVAKTDEAANRAVEILKSHGAADLGERIEQWKREGWSGRYEEKAAEAKPGAAAAPKTAESRATESKPAQARSSIPLSAVEIYETAVEMPAEAGTSRPPYSGPERRTGAERRHAA
jgi:hypothetical protein